DVVGVRPGDLAPVDDTGLRREDSLDAGRVRLDLLDLLRPDHPQTRHAVGGGAVPEVLEPWQLGLVDCHDQLAALLVANSLLLAVLVRLLTALGAETGLQRTRRVVDAGVDHPRVVPGLMLPDRRLFLEDRDARARSPHEKIARRGEADDAAPHDHDVVP